MALQKTPNIGVQVAQTMTPSKIHTPNPNAKQVSNPNSTSNDPLWMQALNALSGIGKPITQQFDYWSDGVRNKKDNPFYSMGYHMGYAPNKAFIDDIQNNGFQFSDLKNMDNKSAFSILSHMGKNMSGFDQTLENYGVTNPYVKGIGGFLGDVALDPTTYLTLGGSSLVKAGTKGMQQTAKSLAKEASKELGQKIPVGLKGYRNVPNKVGEAYYKKALEQTGSEDIAQIARDMVKKSYTEQINNAGKKARYSAQNAAFSVDVPFTKLNWQFGSKPKALTVDSPKIGLAGSNSLNRQLNRVGLVGNNATKFVSKALGKSNLEDVTLQEFRWLKGEIKRYGDFAVNNAPKISFDGSDEAAKAFNQVDKFDYADFIPDSGGRSPIGQSVVDKFRSFNPRYVGKADSGGLVNSYGDAIQDTFGRVRNNMHNFDDEVSQAAKYMEDLNDVEKKALEYTLEGLAPKGFTYAGADMSKVNKAADFLRGRYKTMAEAEQSVGALSKTMPNYAPHVLNRSDSDMEAILQRYADDPELQRLSKVAADNGFDQSRKSFKTMAELDNYLAKLGHQIANETDPGQVAKLTDKMDEISSLFERNPFTAYKKRLHKSYKVRELNKLYRTMEEDGLLLRPDDVKYGATHEFVKLDAKEANKLNVPVGSYMHGEVKDALLKVDSLFTDQGLNKFVETVTSVTNMWKSLATTFRPVHHVNNLIGNLLNNSLVGVGPSSYKKATAVLNRSFRGKPKQEDLDLIADAVANGIFGQVHSDEYRRLFGNQNASKLRKAEKMVTDNRYTKFMRKWLGDSTDNWTRFAHFIDIKAKTGSSEMAAKSVRKHLFNYGEQTQADKTMRLLLPFWTWTKNNIPLQLEYLMKQPRYAQTYLRLQDTSYEVHGEKREDQADFIRNSYVMTPWEKLRNPRSPLTDLNNLDNPLKFLGESTTPLLRVPLFEIPANKQMFSGKTIDPQLAKSGNIDWSAWGKYGLSQAAFANDLYKMGSGGTNPLDFLFGRELEIRED